jgi:hypothetical protein
MRRNRDVMFIRLSSGFIPEITERISSKFIRTMKGFTLESCLLVIHFDLVRRKRFVQRYDYICIRKVSGLNLGKRTGYSGRSRGLPYILRAISGIISRSGHDLILPNNFNAEYFKSWLVAQKFTSHKI